MNMNGKWTRALALLLALLTLAAPALAEGVAETEAPAEPYVELSTPYPAMTVNAGDEMTIDLAIDNYSGSSQDFALSIAELPEGWEGDFSASGQRVGTVHARNGEVIEDVAFEMTVPLEAEAGDYAIVLKAAGEDFADELTIELTVSAEELGNSSFEVEYPEQEGDAQTDFTFSATLINNTLSTQSYALAASAPTGWTVSFTPAGETTRVAALELEARTTQGVSINVAPPQNVAAGTYEIPCKMCIRDRPCTNGLRLPRARSSPCRGAPRCSSPAPTAASAAWKTPRALCAAISPARTSAARSRPTTWATPRRRRRCIPSPPLLPAGSGTYPAARRCASSA